MTEPKHYNTSEQSPFSNGKLLFLGAVTFALAATQALIPLAPVPLAMAILLYGIKAGVAVIGLSLVGAYLLSMAFPALSTMFATLIFVAAIAFVVAKTIFTKEHPVVGLVRSGLSLFAIILLLVGFIGVVSSDGLRGEVTTIVEGMVESFMASEENRRFIESGQGNASTMRELVENPERIVNSVMNWAFGAGFVSVFLAVWICLFLTLRNSPVWRQKVSYPYGLNELIKFRVPDQAVWPLILGLVFYVGSGHFLSEFFAVIGGNILMCLAVFYFFQGFGLYYDVLTHYNVIGLFRSLLVVTAVLFAWEVVILGGVFDMWFNFRKFLNKNKEDKGDMS